MLLYAYSPVADVRGKFNLTGGEVGGHPSLSGMFERGMVEQVSCGTLSSSGDNLECCNWGISSYENNMSQSPSSDGNMGVRGQA
jgi:hypothetical protein